MTVAVDAIPETRIRKKVGVRDFLRRRLVPLGEQPAFDPLRHPFGRGLGPDRGDDVFGPISCRIRSLRLADLRDAIGIALSA